MSRPLRVLVVEDSQDDTLLLLRELERGNFAPSYRRVDNPTDMRDALAFGTWELILADYSMPRFSGGNALALARKSGLELPFIIVSGSIGEETAVAAMKAGAHDFVMKTQLGRLVPVVERELREAEVRRDRRRTEQRLSERLVEIESLNDRLARQQAELAAYNDLVTHDLSNFSMALLGIVERLLSKVEGPLSPEQEILLRRANRQGLVANLLAENARMMARLHQRGLSNERVPIRLAETLRGALRTLREIHFDRTLEVEMSCPEELAASGIPFLETAFLMLLDGVVRRRPPSLAVEIRVSASSENGTVRVAIEAEGGLDEETSYYLLGGDRPADRLTGAVLGLTLAREIVEEVGGRIQEPSPAASRSRGIEVVLAAVGE